MDRYRPVRLLGKGTFGKATLVTHVATNQAYCCKTIRVASRAEMDEALREAELLSTLAHPSILAYTELIRTSPREVNIITEYCDAGDLRQRIDMARVKRTRFSEAQVCDWLAQTLDALAYTHRKDILHRDVKAANLFLATDATAAHGTRVKLGDFGIARPLPQFQKASTPIGTPMNMAPEICRAEPYGQPADLWALGCVAYELCTLRPAFTAGTLGALMARIKKGAYSKQFPHVYSEALRAAVCSMLRVRPEQRPSAAELLQNPLFGAAETAVGGGGREKTPEQQVLWKQLVEREGPSEFPAIVEEEEEEGEGEAGGGSSDSTSVSSIVKVVEVGAEEPKAVVGVVAAAAPAAPVNPTYKVEEAAVLQRHIKPSPPLVRRPLGPLLEAVAKDKEREPQASKLSPHHLPPVAGRTPPASPRGSPRGSPRVRRAAALSPKPQRRISPGGYGGGGGGDRAGDRPRYRPNGPGRDASIAELANWYSRRGRGGAGGAAGGAAAPQHSHRAPYMQRGFNPLF